MLREKHAAHQSPLALARQNAVKGRDLSSLRLLIPLIRPHFRSVLLGLLGVAGASGSMLAVGQIFRRLIDHGIETQNPTVLHQSLTLMLVVVLILAVSSYLRLVLLTGTAEQVVADLRARVLQHLLHLDVSWFEKQKTGDLLSRFTADMALLQVFLGTACPIAIRNMLIVTGGLVLMIASSPSLTFLILCIVPPMVILLVVLGPRLRVLGREVQDKTGLLGAHLSESLSAIREIQAFTREDLQQTAFGQTNRNTIQATWRYVRMRALLSSLVILVIFSGITALLWFGGRQVIMGEITSGQLSAFVFYALLVAGSIGTLSEIYSDLQRASGALERIGDILHTQAQIVTTTSPVVVPAQGDLRFDQVTFHYPTRPDINALDHIDLTLHQGQTVALVGPSGSGKTTLFSLLLRLYDPQSGVISLDGQNIKNFAPQDYRALFGLVPQDPTLFSLSLRDNIAFADPDANDDAIITATKAAGAHDFIMSFPNGYNTLPGERGARLSGGQAQRIALARALLRDPRILLLDEATAHLDSETERVIQNTLLTTRKNRTTLIIAHRLSTVQHADRILVMQAGRIVADGTHQDLINSSPLYQRLAATQFGAE